MCLAIDIAVNGGAERAELVKEGVSAGFNAIGVNRRFVHLGYRESVKHTVLWTY